MTRITTSEARRRFAELVTHARHRGARVLLTHYGKPVAALVSVTDLGRLTDALPGETTKLVPFAVRHASDALMAARQILGPGAVVLERGEKLIGLRARPPRTGARDPLGPNEIRGRGVTWTAAFANVGAVVVETESLVTHEGDTWRVIAIQEGGQLSLTNGRIERTAPVAHVRPFQPAR
jgi:prevent-host-death family protein